MVALSWLGWIGVGLGVLAGLLTVVFIVGVALYLWCDYRSAW